MKWYATTSTSAAPRRRRSSKVKQQPDQVSTDAAAAAPTPQQDTDHFAQDTNNELEQPQQEPQPDSDSETHPIEGGAQLPRKRGRPPKGTTVERAPRMRLQRGSSHSFRVRVQHVDRQPYALKEEEITPKLQKELDDFHRFLTVKFFGQQEGRVSPATATMYITCIKAMLGWLVHIKGEEEKSRRGRKILGPSKRVKELSLRKIFPNSSRESVSLSFDYLQWLADERQCTATTEAKVLHSLIAVAKFLFWKESKADPSEGDKPYQDLLVIRELRKLHKEISARTKNAPKATEEKLKWLEWPEYLGAVEWLRRECAEYIAAGKPRSPTAIAHSYQLYLMFSILACVPDRQRTLRELQVGKTVVKEEFAGKVRWLIKHGPKDYKTGKVYGERPPLIIAEHIYPYLETYLSKWRHHLQPQHDFVFTQKNGKPVSAHWVYCTFSSAAFRLTGKKTNPHLVRDMIVTYLRNTDASERELEALAIYMGHSVTTQKESYDRRTKFQKVAPAIQLIQAIQMQKLPEVIPSTNHNNGRNYNDTVDGTE
ncbi:Integrase-like, catalytic core [Balamuthia mandrillaris]